MAEAGIDVTKFEVHSISGALASKSFLLGSRQEDIIKTADWSSDSTFKTFYYNLLLMWLLLWWKSFKQA